MYNPTEKQKIAIKNMEKVIDPDSSEEIFPDKETFQKYFEYLQNEIQSSIKRTKKSKNFKNAIEKGYINYEEINQKKEKKILDYYTNEKVLKEKVLEYHSKRNASLWKMEKWMLKKTKNNKTIVNEVLKNIKIKEDYIIENLISNWLSTWKSLDALKSKLIYVKLFNKELVEKIIDEKFIHLSVDEKVVKNIIKKWQRQKKSIFQIKSLLYPILKYQKRSSQLIEDYIEEYYSFEIENENFEKELTKLKNKKFDNQKIIKKMMSKGYSYYDIKKQLW